MIEEYTTTQQSYEPLNERKNTITSLFTHVERNPKPAKPKITERAKEFLKSFNIPADAFMNFIALITTNEGFITDVNIDLFEYYEGEEEPLRSISITVCIQGVSIEEKVEVIFKLNKLLYISLPDIPAHFIYECP
jgi:uncharacterized protein (DUF2126 family)